MGPLKYHRRTATPLRVYATRPMVMSASRDAVDKLRLDGAPTPRSLGGSDAEAADANRRRKSASDVEALQRGCAMTHPDNRCSSQPARAGSSARNDPQRWLNDATQPGPAYDDTWGAYHHAFFPRAKVNAWVSYKRMSTSVNVVRCGGTGISAKSCATPTRPSTVTIPTSGRTVTPVPYSTRWSGWRTRRAWAASGSTRGAST